jgi:hypothetical protein
MEPDDFHPDGLPGDLPVAQAAYSRGFMDGMLAGRLTALVELEELAAAGSFRLWPEHKDPELPPLKLDWGDSR